mgnify:CR=1 FL=1
MRCCGTVQRLWSRRTIFLEELSRCGEPAGAGAPPSRAGTVHRPGAASLSEPANRAISTRLPSDPACSPSRLLPRLFELEMQGLVSARRRRPIRPGLTVRARVEKRDMAKALVVVESPAKAKTINKYLGRDYKVIASMGHIRDLPKSKLGVDVDNDFAETVRIARNRARRSSRS